MNYHRYYPIDVVNGPGTRCTLFVSGCTHKCRGCYNKATWKVNSGFSYTIELENKIIEDLKDIRILRQGLSLSGGDPLHPSNLSVVLNLLKRVRRECIGKDVWMWTGYTLRELDEEQKQVINLVDVLIDGKFIEKLKDPAILWRGSSNQMIYYLR